MTLPATAAPLDVAALAAKGWNEAQIAALLAARHEDEDEAAALAALEEERVAAATAPEAVIAATLAAAAEKRTVREMAEREREADRVYAEACARYGEERTARIRTIRGSVILRPLTATEVDAGIHRSINLKGLDLVRLGRSEVKATRLYPSAERFDAIVEEFPGLWDDLFAARTAIIEAVRAESEKKGQP